MSSLPYIPILPEKTKLSLQSQIKDIVINNLLSSLTSIATQLSLIQTENTLLKKTLTYLLKKMFLITKTNHRPAHSRSNSTSLSETFHPIYKQNSNPKNSVKPTTSFLYTPTEYNTLNIHKYNTTNSVLNTKITDCFKIIYQKPPINTRKHYLLYKDPSSLYEDLFGNDNKKQTNSNAILNTDISLNKNNSVGQIRTKILNNNSNIKKLSSTNRITYRNLSMKNIHNSTVNNLQMSTNNNSNKCMEHNNTTRKNSCSKQKAGTCVNTPKGAKHFGLKNKTKSFGGKNGVNSDKKGATKKKLQFIKGVNGKSGKV